MPAGLDIRLRVPTPGLLGLPWAARLADWDATEVPLRDIAVGPSRHLVRFVESDGGLWALKELPPRIAQKEFGVLRELESRGLAAVRPAGVVGPSAAVECKPLQRARQHPSVEGNMIGNHALGGEPSLYCGPAGASVQVADVRHPFGHLLDVRAEEPGDAVVDDFGCRPVRERQHWRPARQCLDHYQPEGLGPGDWIQQGFGAAEEPGLLRPTHLTEIGDAVPEERGDLL